MNDTDTVSRHVPGNAGERERRVNLLQKLRAAFARGGRDAVGAELKATMDELQQDFGAKLEALKATL
ncbi:MAG TPA: hypothetical protein VEL76_08760 [Gemmataceae bacterium]|nr:hypothetical protein [Gemmataceae bacterium]